MYQLRYNIYFFKFKVQKIQINTNLCCHTGLLKVLLNLYIMHRYSSGTTTLLQTLVSKREKHQNIRAYY